MKPLTETQTRALIIIDGGEIESPAQFAGAMWPDSPAWSKPGKCGPYGTSKGLGIRMAGGGYLGKLRKAGLIDWRYRGSYSREYFLTDKGRSLLPSNLNSPAQNAE